MTGSGARGGLLLAIGAVLAIAWTLTARISGPDDLWDQTQPTTASYTSDIVARGRWILPVERGVYPGTKPPLYNWLAAPAVAALGYGSAFAHKLPSVLAFLACGLVVWRAGRVAGRTDGSGGGSGGGDGGGAMCGPLAVLAFAATYPTFKLAYLARPDMVLTLWLVLGWWAATRVIEDGRRRDAAVLWTCVALAALTKGPPALVLVAYALLAAPLFGGRSALRATGWTIGLPLALVPIALWIWAAWRIDPVHVRETLLFDEIAGRVSGVGPEGSKGGPWEILRGAFDMPVYYVVRFLPWSVPSVFAIVAIVRKRPRSTVLSGAALYVGLAILLFSLSASRRADYIASAYGPGAVLAAWWLLDAASRRRRMAPVGAVAAATVALVLLTAFNRRESAAPVRGFGDAIAAFTVRANDAIERRPAPVVFSDAGTRQLQAMLGASSPDGRQGAIDLVAAGEPFWLVEGAWGRAPTQLAVWVRTAGPASIESVEVGADLPMMGGWPGRVHLFRIEPGRSETGPETGP